jgi:hypothetical protein
MNKTSQTPNCCIRKTGRDIARIAFEIPTPFQNNVLRTEILRKSNEEGEVSCRPEGLLLDAGAAVPPVVIAHVYRGDEIIVRFQTNAGAMVHESHFRISKTFVPKQIHRVDTWPVTTPHHSIEADDGALILMDACDLKRLFRDRHPAWLENRINMTLEMWRKENPALFLRVAPSACIAQDASLLVRHEPERALEEFNNDLDDELLSICIERRPEAAIRHAFDRIPRADRIGLVRKYSNFVLNHHLDRLSELELEVASSADAMTAFKLRHFVEDRRHALLLAKSYPAAFFIEPREDWSQLEAEVRQSVLEHPRIWRRSHYRSFGILCRSLQSTLGICFSGEQLLQLSENLGTKLKLELQQYIGSQI